MKFVAFWEYDPKDQSKVIEKFKKRRDTGFKVLYGPFGIGGQPKGCTIFETDKFEHIAEYTNHYSPELRIKVYPIEMSSKIVEHLKL